MAASKRSSLNLLRWWDFEADSGGDGFAKLDWAPLHRVLVSYGGDIFVKFRDVSRDLKVMHK